MITASPFVRVNRHGRTVPRKHLFAVYVEVPADQGSRDRRATVDSKDSGPVAAAALTVNDVEGHVAGQPPNPPGER